MSVRYRQGGRESGVAVKRGSTVSSNHFLSVTCIKFGPPSLCMQGELLIDGSISALPMYCVRSCVWHNVISLPLAHMQDIMENYHISETAASWIILLEN